MRLTLNNTAWRRGAGFTLIELLVVIAVIALLIGILLPALGRARDAGRGVICLSNFRQVATGWHLYCDAYKDVMVAHTPPTWPGAPRTRRTTTRWGTG